MAAGDENMTVVKMGGAFVAARELESVVAKLRERYGRRLAFVAGGGRVQWG